MLSRRDLLKHLAATGAAVTLGGWTTAEARAAAVASRLPSQEVLTRVIPSSGEPVPVIGLGSSATFSRVARSEDYSALREVLSAFVENGGRIFDTAPSYGASEEVAGDIAAELGITDEIFWATKVNVAGRGGGSADPQAARDQIERSFDRFGVETMELIQVHNMGDPPTQLGILQELKEAGRVRYIGITTTSEGQYPNIMEVMRNEPIDFIGIDYAVDNRSAADEVLPLAQERGIGVLVYAPFGRTRLWSRVGDRDVPDWAAEFDATSWAQFFLKFVVAHPAVTAATPSTSKAHHMVDNLGGGMGRLPTPEHLRRMIELVDGLPEAPGRG